MEDSVVTIAGIGVFKSEEWDEAGDCWGDTQYYNAEFLIDELTQYDGKVVYISMGSSIINIYTDNESAAVEIDLWELESFKKLTLEKMGIKA